jgi:two-component system nitrogen regulation response regulator NtrX
MQGLPPRELAPEAEAQLQTMRWPGNVRQLRNTLERALILGPDHGSIEPEELALESAPNGSAASGMLGAAFAGLALRDAREMFEREYLVAQINRFGGNISRTANFVGMERSALHRKLKSLNVISAGRSDRNEDAEAHA